MIPEVWKLQRNDIIMYRSGPHNYNNRSITKRVNHVTTFITAPKTFKMDAEEKMTTHMGTDYLAYIDPRKDTITVKPLENHSN